MGASLWAGYERRSPAGEIASRPAVCHLTEGAELSIGIGISGGHQGLWMTGASTQRR